MKKPFTRKNRPQSGLAASSILPTGLRKGMVIIMIYEYIYITFLIILALMLFPCLIRAIRGPRIADRLMSVNMMGTLVMVMIAILALLLHEGYLVDVCLVYAMISFLAVVVLTKVYIGIYEEKRHASDHPDEEDKGGMSDGNF